MSDAIARMVIYLAHAEPWKADRWTHTGPSLRPIPSKPRPVTERNPQLKARILTELRCGPATSDTLAKALHRPQQEVGAKLSRLYRDGQVERALSATSPHTGRKVLVYSVKSRE